MKNTLRQKIIKHRKSLSVSEIQAINTEFLQKFIIFFDYYNTIHKPLVVGGYIPINNEINVLPALDYCRQFGLKTALPYCHGKDTLLTFHNFDGDMQKLSHDALQILAPHPNSDNVVPDLILCPAVGASITTHQRLGYGGGFFDRYITQHPQIHCVSGICNYQMIDNTDIFSAHDLIFYHIIKI